MWTDKLLTFSNKQDVSSATASSFWYNAKQDRDLGVGEEMAVCIDLTTNVTGSGTITATVQSAAASNFSGATSHGSVNFTTADGAGKRKVILLPKDDTVGQYIRVNYTKSGTVTAANASAVLGPAKNVDAWKTYPRGYTF